MAIPGGDYTAIQSSDGTWTILDVPFMAVGEVSTYNAAGERVGSHDFDEAWLEKAIEIARLKRAEKFLARVFIDHHEGEGSQDGAGYLMPTRVGELPINGTTTAVLHGDLLHVPQHAYWRIKEGDLPYRSFEAFNPAGGFVSGLALMPTMPPRFDLPILTIGTEIPWVEPCEPDSVSHETGYPMEAPVGLVACASKTQAVSAHRRGPRMPKPDDTTIKPEAAAFVTPPAAAKAMDDEDEGKKREPEADDETGKGEDDGADDTERKPTDTDGTPATVESVMRTVRGFEGTPEEVKSLLAELVRFLHEMGGDEESEEGPPEQDAPPAAAAAKRETGTMSKAEKDAVEAKAMAALAKGEVEKMKAEREVDRAVAAATKDLAAYPLGADPEKTLRAVAEEDGLSGLAVFVRAVKAHGTKSPGDGDSDDEPAAGVPDLPDDVASNGDPDVQSRAFAAAREFDQRAAAGWPVQPGERDRFIRRAVAGRRTPLIGRK